MTCQSDIPLTGFLSRKWVKAYFSISNSTLHQWVADKRLPAPIKIGPRAVRFRAEDIRAFVTKLTASNKEPC